MANITSQSTQTSGRAQNYAKKDAVAISAVNASVPMFEQRLQQIRAAHGKDGFVPKVVVGEDGKTLRDENGDRVIARDSKGRTIHEAKYVQAYSLVQSFAHEELAPEDPESWTRAQEYGRAVAEDRFPGHPVLVATEISGRSGCVHNHLIVGAVHPETGKSIDSNVVTHSRLSIEHDRVLAENGFEQRADMKQMTLEAAKKMEERRAEVIAAAGEDVTPSELKRRLLAAENSVKLESTSEVSAHQKRDAKRLREFDRYRLNEQDREACLDIGVAPPKEKFSEIELESRIKDTINDPRATSWEAVAEIGRQNHVTIDRRGKNDVTYGMMLAQPDGTIAEPSRAHRRRGGIEGSGKGLGRGFRRDDVEKAVGRNAALARAITPAEQPSVDQVMDVDMSFLDEYRTPDAQYLEEPTEHQLDGRRQFDELSDQIRARVDRESTAPDRDEVDEQTEVTHSWVDEKTQTPQRPATGVETEGIEQSHPPEFRSGLRDRTVKSPQTRERLDAFAYIEEDYHGRKPDAVFEQRLKVNGGAGPKVINTYGQDMSPEFRSHLEARVELRSKAEDVNERRTEKLEKAKELQERDGLHQRHAGQIRILRQDAAFDRRWVEDVRGQVAEGDYSPRDYDKDRHEHRKQEVSQRAAELQPSEARQRLAEDDRTLRRAHDEQAFFDRDQDQGLEK